MNGWIDDTGRFVKTDQTKARATTLNEGKGEIPFSKGKGE
jgi:hypothetical protein